jgi:hypothetical protein
MTTVVVAANRSKQSKNEKKKRKLGQKYENNKFD